MCNDDDKIKGIEIQIGDTVYENTLGELTLSITEACNMNCIHCRENLNGGRRELTADDVKTIMKFVRKYTPTYKDITISGGEPFLHSDFFSILQIVKENGGEDISITTNGTLITEEIIKKVKKIGFSKVEISVSLDSLNKDEHNNFRNNKTAYDSVIHALEILCKEKNENFRIGLRTSLIPQKANLKVMEEFVNFAKKWELNKITFSSIIPIGRAKDNPSLLMNVKEKNEFIKNIYILQKKYQKKGEFLIRTNDPLKFYYRGYSDVSTSDNEIIFDGCGAGVVAMNFKYDGYLYPCSLLDYKMFYFKGKSVSELEELYKNDEFVKKMILMKLEGKCGKCNFKFQCGGCRARALYATGNIMGEDPECFIM